MCNSIFFITETLGPLPAVKDLESRIRVQLINSHRSIYPPRPSMPGLISVGGAHIKPPKPLPENIQVFIKLPLMDPKINNNYNLH